jgi:hypothetical protein
MAHPDKTERLTRRTGSAIVLALEMLCARDTVMAPTKLPDSVILTIEVIGWVAIIPVMGMILTFIGESIYASLVIAR